MNNYGYGTGFGYSFAHGDGHGDGNPFRLKTVNYHYLHYGYTP